MCVKLQFCDKAYGCCQGPRAWIGINDLQQENHWTQVNGRPVTRFFWKWDEPNNNDDGEDCVEIWPTTGVWNDDSCTNLQPYVCSFPYVPATKTREFTERL